MMAIGYDHDDLIGMYLYVYKLQLKANDTNAGFRTRLRSPDRTFRIGTRMTFERSNGPACMIYRKEDRTSLGDC